MEAKWEVWSTNKASFSQSGLPEMMPLFLSAIALDPRNDITEEEGKKLLD